MQLLCQRKLLPMERKHGRSRVWIGVKWSSGLDLASVRKEWNFGRGVKGREKGGHIVDHPCLSSWGFHWLGLAGIIKKDLNLELDEGKGSPSPSPTKRIWASPKTLAGRRNNLQQFPREWRKSAIFLPTQWSNSVRGVLIQMAFDPPWPGQNKSEHSYNMIIFQISNGNSGLLTFYFFRMLHQNV